MVQQWRVRSNLYKVKLSSITLSTGQHHHNTAVYFFLRFFMSKLHILDHFLVLVDFSKVLKTLSADSTRDELLVFLHNYGSHYMSEALYGSELSCSIYFPSKKAQQQLWLQYQKGECQQTRGDVKKQKRGKMFNSFAFKTWVKLLSSTVLISLQQGSLTFWKLGNTVVDTLFTTVIEPIWI